MTPERAILDAWGLWVVSWVVAAIWSDRTVTRPAYGDQLRYRAVTLFGALLLFSGFARPYRARFPLWLLDRDVKWGLVAIAVGGFGFAWWARLHLGRLWSSSVTRKTDHRVVDTGPYGLVRHPIYTGLIAACLATAAMRGTVVAIAGAILMTVGFHIKATLEERFLREQLGPDAYDAYRRRVPMLVPFGPAST
jgi:protein-S-isoprenylcysteine O-methyltransferase Ste14